MKVLLVMRPQLARRVAPILARELPEMDLVVGDPAEGQAPLEEADFLVGGGLDLTAEVLRRARRLRLIQEWGARVEGVDLRAARELGIPVASTAGANAAAVAEHFFALLLALTRRLLPASRALADGRWTKAELVEEGLVGLEGSTLGLVGFGHIGQAVARRARAFEMEVLYFRRRRPEAAGGARFAPLEELLVSSDVVGLALPATEETRGMVDGAFLARMKPSAFLINVSRGALVDEAELYRTLRAGLIAGAGLDVFDPEPPRPSHPLLSLPNVVATPHLAGMTARAIERVSLACAANVRRAALGQPVEHQVQPLGVPE